MERIIIVHWNKSVGPEPIIQYPPEKKFPSNDLFLKIWALHELDQDSSMIEFIPEMNQEQFISILQKFEGEIYFIIIVYKKDNKIKEVVKDHPDILAIVSKNLIELINTNKITRAISEAYHTIKNYSRLEIEENILIFFKDKIKYTILKILRDGVISKEKLNDILRREYGFSTVNIDLLLVSFLRENLIIKRSVPGSHECYFLVNDLSFMRIPPIKIKEIGQNNREIIKDFEKEIKIFFSSYDCISEIENKNILNLLIHQNVYSLIQKLRNETLSVTNCLDILNNNEDLFNELLEKKIIYEAKGKVILFSDIRFIIFPPYYILKKLSQRYINSDISFDEFFTHLKVLLSHYDKVLDLINYEII
ncbi:MAG: hypothetical protein ACFFAO_19505 [Candidatus Hermodarchaeota archaeon]